MSETVVDQLYDRLGIQILDVSNTTDVTTDMGRMMFTMNSAIASVERSRFLKRSMDATLRHAENGVWLGGLASYGYRVTGKKKEARLSLSHELIGDLGISEVEVVQSIYRWAAEDKESCFVIADKLNAMGIPTSYTRDEREVLNNKRKQKTANRWRAGRVRNMLVEPTYKGVHVWGKRQKKKRPTDELRPIIERKVPAIVDEQTWERAQQTLSNNRLMSSRNSKRQYLLRGKIKCGLCGLTYSGTVSRGPRIENVTLNRNHPSYEEKDGFFVRAYYCCTGKSNFRGLYGQDGKRCPSRMISGQIIEESVWEDIELFLRNPGQVLEEIQTAATVVDSGAEHLNKERVFLKRSLDGIESEKEKVLTLFRKSIIDEATLVAQLKSVETNKGDLETQVEQVESELKKLDDQQQQCQSTRELLHRLNGVLDDDLTFELKRKVVEALVESIHVDTHTEGKRKSATVTVFYRFEKPEANGKSFTLTKTGEGVRADSCSTAGKPNPNPAPRPKSGAT